MKSLQPMFLLTVLYLLASSQPTKAATTLAYEVTLDTNALESDSGDKPFSLLLQLNSGGTSGVSNAVTLSEFNFHGGSPGDPSSESSNGEVTGDLSSEINLNSSDGGFNIFNENFNPGNNLSFLLTTTADQVDASAATPDEFSLQILDSAGNPVPTADPSGADSLVTFTYAQPLQIAAYGSDSSRTTTANQSLNFSAPVISPVPEPTTALTATTMLLLLSRCRRTRVIQSAPALR